MISAQNPKAMIADARKTAVKAAIVDTLREFIRVAKRSKDPAKLKSTIRRERKVSIPKCQPGKEPEVHFYEVVELSFAGVEIISGSPEQDTVTKYAAHTVREHAQNVNLENLEPSSDSYDKYVISVTARSGRGHSANWKTYRTPYPFLTISLVSRHEATS